jgi:catechol 2,3-dioxygenase-like lactoylglutathione lyase family enzyme
MLPPKSFDHVALWVVNRDAIADLLCDSLGLHVIERTDTFTLAGAHAREGKVTLFDSDGPREPGALERIVFRVSDIDKALERLPDRLTVAHDGDVAWFGGPESLAFGLVERATELDYDLDHVVLRARDPEALSAGLADLGFRREEDGRLVIGDRHVSVIAGAPGDPGRSTLNHLAVLVDSADDHIEHARELGVPIEEIKDAPNTYAGFVTGPEGVRVEFVEHKPTFALV